MAHALNQTFITMAKALNQTIITALKLAKSVKN